MQAKHWPDEQTAEGRGRTHVRQWSEAQWQIAYEAFMTDEEAKSSKVEYLSGSSWM